MTVAAAVAGRTAANRAAANAIAEKRAASTSTSTSTASPAPETERGEEPAPFVPRRRPALPPTRAQRAAAQAAGVKLPPPGAPMPSTPEETATGRTVEPEGVPATSPGRRYLAQEVTEAIPSHVPPPERGGRRGRADSGVARGPPPGFRARAAPEDEATAPVDPPPAPAPRLRRPSPRRTGEVAPEPLLNGRKDADLGRGAARTAAGRSRPR